MFAGQRVIAGEVKGLPPIRHIAAGQSHALLSDGERVWAFGRLLDSSGKEATTASWSSPQVVNGWLVRLCVEVPFCSTSSC